jgi:hypothetical protein
VLPPPERVARDFLTGSCFRSQPRSVLGSVLDQEFGSSLSVLSELLRAVS